jgi:hypothetical protein
MSGLTVMLCPPPRREETPGTVTYSYASRRSMTRRNMRAKHPAMEYSRMEWPGGEEFGVVRFLLYFIDSDITFRR